MNLDFQALITTCISLLLLIAVGFIFRKIGILDEDFTKKLSSLVAKAAMPFLIVHSITSLAFSTEKLINGLLILFFGTLAHTFMALAAKLIFCRTRDFDEKKIYEYGCIFSNCAFIGYPILNALFGEIGLFYGAFYVITYNLGCWSYGMIIMSRGKPERKITVRKMFINIGTVACAIGLALYISQIPIPSFLRTTMNHIGSLCTPLSLLVTGSLLAAMPLKNVFCNPKLYAFCGVKLILLPLIAALLLHLCGVSALIAEIDLTVFLAMMIGLPPAAMTSLFANMYDVKPSYAAQLVSLGTMLSPLTILIVIKLTEMILLI
ncbi:MAG: AEC family transporter [Clostridia bacterium]|nr:AEC family transporter [Clostridia bacterium]